MRSPSSIAIRNTVFVVTLCLAPGAWGEQPIVYPAKGQTPAQQSKDEGECHMWAKQTTGVDPAALAAQPAPPTPTPHGGNRMRGAARGAAGGAAIGAIAGDAEAGAAAGAAAGAMKSGRTARMAEAKSAQASQAAQAQKDQQLATYNRARSACLVGRGYTVQ